MATVPLIHIEIGKLLIHIPAARQNHLSRFATKVLSFFQSSASKPQMHCLRFVMYQIVPIFLGLTLCSSAWAEKPSKHDAQTDRLQGLNSLELSLLAPYLKQGPIALVEFANTRQDQLPAINLATLVHAPATKLFEVITHPKRYPQFMPTIDRIKVIEQYGSTIVYEWSWKLSLFTLRGQNSMTIYKPRSSSSTSGYRVTLKSRSGDLGKGRVSMRIRPVSTSTSVMVISARLDMRSANYVVRQMAKASRSINRSTNILVTCSTLFALKEEVERQVGHQAPKASIKKLTPPSINTQQILPLLSRGDLLFFNIQGSQLEKISILGRLKHSKRFIRDLMLDARAFGSALVPGSYARVVTETEKKMEFIWGINLPLVDVEGRMRLQDRGEFVAVDAISGALGGGQWRFNIQELSDKESIVTGWTRFDMKNSTWLLEYLISIDPNISHGLSAAADVMLIRSLRSRARKKSKHLAASQVVKASNKAHQKKLSN